MFYDRGVKRMAGGPAFNPPIDGAVEEGIYFGSLTVFSYILQL